MINSCRSCNSSQLQSILSLGSTPLANAFLTIEQLNQPEPTYPLDLAFCPDCALVQITETVPPEELFREYLYFSSFSDTVLQEAEKLAGKMVRRCGLNDKSLVVEIASNDGYLLQYYQQQGVPVLGIEPAVNVAQTAVDRGIPTLCQFFSHQVALQLASQGQQADVLHANNVLAHVADLNGFVAGIASLLKNSALAVIEVPYLKDLIDKGEFDTIYHEHLCYFSLTALDQIFRRHGLIIGEVERLLIHGGSLRLFICKNGAEELFNPAQLATVEMLLKEEASWEVNQVSFYQNFGAKVEALRHKLTTLLQDLKKENKRIAAYGASAKGSTLLNYFGIGQDILDFVVDRNPNKQERYTPGTHLPIYSPEKLLDEMPDYVLLLTWNFADEILKQQSEFRRRGGRFIIFMPEIKIL